MYSSFPEMQIYKMWELNNYWGLNDYDYGYPRQHPQQPQQSNKKPKHKYCVNDLILDVDNDRIGLIRELLTWPNYLVVDSSTPTKSWICNEAHIEPLAKDIDESDSLSINESSINDYWEEEQESTLSPTLSTLYTPLSTKITDITDTEDIIISKDGVDLVNDGGICVTDTVNKHDKDIDELRYISDNNMQKTSDIEVKIYDIEQNVTDLEKKQKRISKLSKLALLSRFL